MIRALFDFCPRFRFALGVLLVGGIFTSTLTAQTDAQALEQTSQPTSSRRQVSESSSESIASLINRLGDDDYANRNDAEMELEKRGNVVLSSLEKVLQPGGTDDTEIQLRAQRLQIRIQKDAYRQKIRRFLNPESASTTDTRSGLASEELPGWTQFASVVGDSGSARKMYVGMYRHHHRLIESLEMGLAEAEEALRRASGPSVQSTSQRLDRLSSLMFASCYPFDEPLTTAWQKTKTGQQRAIYSQLIDPGAITYVKSCVHRTEIKTLIDNYLEQAADTDFSLTLARLKVIETYQLENQANYVLDVLSNESAPLPLRVQAVLIFVSIGKSETPADANSQLQSGQKPNSVPKVQLAAKEFVASKAILNDDRVVGRFLPADRKQSAPRKPRPASPVPLLEVQFRDLIFAAQLHLAGKHQTDFGFPYDQDRENGFSKSRCGFFDPASRDAALNSWREK